MTLFWFVYLFGRVVLTSAYECDSELVKALSSGDTNPMGAIAAAKTHNLRTQIVEEGCRKHFSKIINLGLPRTGTLSFIRVMEHNFGLQSCHQLPNNWPQYVDQIELWRNNPYKVKPKLKKALSQCIVLADIPIYALYRSFKVRYPKSIFVMTTRGLDSWLNSTELLMKLWKGKMENGRIQFIRKFFKVHNKLGWSHKEYAATWLAHTQAVIEYFGEHVLLLPIEFSDSDKIKSLSAFTGCHSQYDSYAHFHDSHGSSASKHINQFSKKCLKYPKKCGF